MVFFEVFHNRAIILIDKFLPDTYIIHIIIQCSIFFHQSIGFLIFLKRVHPRRTRLDGNKQNTAFRIMIMNETAHTNDIFHKLFRSSLRLIQIIIAFIDNDLARIKRLDNLIEKIDLIAHHRTTECPVHYHRVWKILLCISPSCKRRATYK